MFRYKFKNAKADDTFSLILFEENYHHIEKEYLELNFMQITFIINYSKCLKE